MLSRSTLSSGATLPGVDGKTHSIFGQAGPNGLVVAFICNHCPYVKAVIDRMVDDAMSLLAEGIGIAAICSNDAAAYPEDGFERMKASGENARLAIGHGGPPGFSA